MRLYFSAEKNRKLIPVLLGFLVLGGVGAVHELAYQAIID